jgi:transcriptional regulator with XRE-family HTH domain
MEPQLESSSRSTQRQRFEAEISEIKKRFGGLDDMRKVLGLSRRQICQALMVDPSAWTRWTSNDEAAPAHVYKTLALIMEQNLRDPKTQTPATTSTKAQGQVSEVENSIDDLRSELRSEIHAHFETLNKSLNETSELNFGWKLLLVLNVVLVLYVIFR